MTSTGPHTGPSSEPDPRTQNRGATTVDTTGTGPHGGEAELVYDDTPAPPGRPVRLVPTPPGFWRVVGGAIVAVLAPFFGILIGSTRGSEEVASRMDPIYWGFAIGCIIGGLGMVAVILGARRLWRDARARKQEEAA